MITLRDIILVVDDREKALFPHLSCEAQEIRYVKQRITTGDYAIVCEKTNQMLAVIERKSLVDFAASLKDGRILNKQDLIDMRTKTGCRVIYIIEGPMAPQPTQCFGNIPYDRIESNIFHMMMRDNIQMMYTLNTQHTITKLVSFIKSMITLLNSGQLADIKPDAAITTLEKTIAPTTAPDGITTEGAATSNEPNLNELLTAPVAKTDLDTVRTMWSKFRGVSSVTADIFITKISLADLICGRITSEEIRNFKSAGGKTLGKNIVESLTSITTGYNKALEEKILAEINGISAATAKELLTNRNLRQLLSYEPGAISIIKVGKTQRNFGPKKAADILKYFNYKLDADGKPQTTHINPLANTQQPQPNIVEPAAITTALKKL